MLIHHRWLHPREGADAVGATLPKPGATKNPDKNPGKTLENCGKIHSFHQKYQNKMSCILLCDLRKNRNRFYMKWLDV